MTPFQQLYLGMGAKKKTYMDDVFSTYLWAGSGSARSINNGIDLSGEGGMVWIKNRTYDSNKHVINDTVRGHSNAIMADVTDANFNHNSLLNGFNSNGFDVNTGDFVNGSSQDYASWTFRKSPGFFDVVTYTGNETNRTISHSLGCVPGMILIKRTDATEDWMVYHRGNADSNNAGHYHFKLNGDDAKIDSSTKFNDTQPTASVFSVGTSGAVNLNNATYVAYLFAGGESEAATARSVAFDGNDALTLAASNDFHCTGDLTIEGWFNPDILDDSLFGIGNKGGAFGINVYLDGTDLKMDHSAALKMTVSGTPLPEGQWTHVALVRSGTTVRLYINGISRATYNESNDFGGSSDSQKTFAVGSTLNSGSPSDQFDGKISNFRVVNGTAVYTSSFRPPTEPLTNITNTKLLCCNNSSTTGSTVTPGTITAVGDPTASTDSPFDDPAGFVFGENKDQNVIKCNSYIGTGSTAVEINLGWEPQYILHKRTDGTRNWVIFDCMRGIVTGGDEAEIFPSLGDNESNVSDRIQLTPTGYKVISTSAGFNNDGSTYAYMAIRRPDGYVGKPADAGTDVFNMDPEGSNVTTPPYSYISGFPVDFGLNREEAGGSSWTTNARLMGKKAVYTHNSNAEATHNDAVFDSSTGYYKNGPSGKFAWMWKRSSSFDVVTYDGSSASSLYIPHSLNAVPEMIWLKCRSEAEDWRVYHKGLNGGTNPQDYYLRLNTTAAEADAASNWNDTAPTSTHFTVGNDGAVNNNNRTYLAMLFASVSGISKVGYFDGSDSEQTITTGFQPRFLIIKNATTVEDWHVFDTVRGWASGNDTYLKLNSDTAQASGYDFGAPTSTGFTLTGNNSAHNNAGDKFIYYAHA